MEPAKADVERHRKDWEWFVAATKYSTAFVVVILVLLWIFLA